MLYYIFIFIYHEDSNNNFNFNDSKFILALLQLEILNHFHFFKCQYLISKQSIKMSIYSLITKNLT